MPRKNKTNKQIGRFSESSMKEAVMLVIENKMSIRGVSKQKGLSFQTVSRYVQKYRKDDTAKLCPNYSVNRIFPVELELKLYEYLILCSKMFYGLTLTDCRSLAYELGVKNNITVPETWSASRKASTDWMKGFRQRFPELSLRTPEGCSLSRATGFNKFNVSTFFNKLEEVLKRHPQFADGSRIFNLDETATTTVQKSQKILAQKGVKQVSKATSAERGTLVTTCCIINALGNSIPPVMIFPRVNFKEHMTSGAPAGTLGLATKAGWMNSECFVQVIHHFIKYTASSKENPTLLLMDNHESHLSIEAIDLCKENGVTVLTIPPHCTHKLQPLDVSVMKPFHTFYDAAVDSWMMSHPGETFSIYNVGHCVGIAYPRGVTPVNITAGFKKTGIFPFDCHVFNEDDFLPSSVTDRPLNVAPNEVLPPETDVGHPSHEREPQSTETRLSPPQTGSISTSYVSPEDIRGFPKAKPRKAGSRRRPKGRTMIATDTPERYELYQKRKQKQIKGALPKRALFLNDDSDDDGSEVILQDSSGDEVFDVSQLIPEPELLDFEDLERSPIPGDYVLVEFETKKKIYYIGKIISYVDESTECEVSFLRKSVKLENKFVMPNVPDISFIDKKCIKTLLPMPTTFGKTKRQQSALTFEINFASYDVR